MNNRDTVASLVVFAVIVMTALSSVFQVYETKQALVLEFGHPERTISQPGLHFKWPWESVTLIDKRVLLLDLPVQEIITSDQKRILVDAYARFRVVDPLKFYQTVRDEKVGADRLDTLVNSTIRQVLGDAPFASLLTPERIALRERVRSSVNAEGAQLGIDVMDVRIKRANLPDENSEAIYKRMQAERERLAKEARAQGAEQAQMIRSAADRERTIILANAQRDAQITRGQGDAKAIKIFADSFGKDPEFYAFYRSMQAYTKALSGKDTTMVLSPGSGFLEYFDENKAMGKR